MFKADLQKKKKESSNKKQAAQRTHHGKLHHVRLHCFDDDFSVLEYERKQILKGYIFINHSCSTLQPCFLQGCISSRNTQQCVSLL